MNADERAEFTEYVRERSPALKRTAYLLTGDQQQAEDLVQSALIKTMASWGRIRNREKVDPYVRRVMLNEQRAWWRRRASRERPTADLPERSQPDTSDASDERDLMQRALHTLPARQRATVVLRFYDDYSEADTAAILGCSIGTVKSQTAKALAKLRVALATPHNGDVTAAQKGASHAHDRE